MIRGPIGPRGPSRTARPVEELRNDDLFHSASIRMADHHPDYDKLPVAIQAHVSPKDYLWLDDDGKRNLIADFTLPEVGED